MVSILCTARSGATNLSWYLKNVLEKDLIISPFGEGSINSLKKDNLYKLMIHRLPNEYLDMYKFGSDIIELSDKVILFDRKDKKEQAESLAFRKCEK